MRGVQGAHELSCNAPGRGKGNEVQEAVQAKNKKNHARQISGNCGSGSHYRFSFWIDSHSMASSILISIQLMMYTSEGFRLFMTRGFQGTDHAWLVMMKAMRGLTRYAAAGIEETGLGLSDF